MKRRLLITTLALAASSSVSAQTLSGPATAIDGRTLDFTGTPIRLAHLDAPEGKQSCNRDNQDWACGREAKANLAQLVGGRTVTCAITQTDPDHIRRAICTAGNLDIGREMVRRGMALAIENAPSNYVTAQEIAQRMAFGLWSGEFEYPSIWRTSHPDAALFFTFENAAEPDPAAHSQAIQRQSSPVSAQRRFTNATGCAIKGNHSRRGDWIYHLPGQRYYDKTRPEELFCTEEAARAAGYRRSKE
ncbi:MAG: thermonuclease family protein [Pseudomonadota bacterium]